MPKPLNRNTKQHGKAAAVALLHDLEQINGHSDFDARLEDQAGVKLVGAYLEAMANAPEQARKGFALFIGDYLSTVAGGCVPDSGNYRAATYDNSKTALPVAGAPRTIAECKAHARVWLKGDRP